MSALRKAETAPADAAAVLTALLDSETNPMRGRPRLSGEAMAYLRGAADALAAVEVLDEPTRGGTSGVFA